jgi:thiol-disulfide isomerase/thioredoxin
VSIDPTMPFPYAVTGWEETGWSHALTGDRDAGCLPWYDAPAPAATLTRVHQRCGGGAAPVIDLEEVPMDSLVALAAALLVTLAPDVEQGQTEYTGRLSEVLTPSTGISVPLERADPAVVRSLPASERHKAAKTAVLRVGPKAQGRRVVITSGPAGRTLYLERADHRFWRRTDGVGGVSRKLEAGYLSIVRFDVPLEPGSPWRTFPVEARTIQVSGSGAASRREYLVFGACASGVVRVGATEIGVRYCDNVDPLAGTVSLSEGRLDLDANGDGVFDVSDEGIESQRATVAPGVFRVGERYVSTRVVDPAAHRVVLHEHPPEDYTRIELEIGRAIPDLAFTDLDGERRTVGGVGQGFVLLQFWGTWCGPCLGDFPLLRSADERFRGRGLRIVGLPDEKVGFYHEDLAAACATVKRTVAERGATWMQADPADAEALAARFRVSSLPTYVLLDPARRIVSWGAAGQLELRGEGLLKTLDSLLPKQ